MYNDIIRNISDYLFEQDCATYGDECFYDKGRYEEMARSVFEGDNEEEEV